MDSMFSKICFFGFHMLVLVVVIGGCAAAYGQSPAFPQRPMMDLPAQTRAWYRNPDGSCVQCSNGMVGAYHADDNLASLLWDTQYGPAIRGGSTPTRVANYCRDRKIPIYNVTGRSVSDTLPWMEWCCKTGRFAAIGAGGAHFQTLYGRDYQSDLWYVCNNNSTHKIDEYTPREFQSLHAASGPWVVIPNMPPPAPVPNYVKWWK